MGRIHPNIGTPGAPCRTGTLYDPRFEHDACGVGFIARIDGRPSHEILRQALEAVRRLSHRGAVAADGRSGDGAGVLTQLPRDLFLREAEALGHTIGAEDLLGVGMVFLPRDGASGAAAALETGLQAQRLTVLGWRTVPVETEALGEGARLAMPHIRQVLVLAPAGMGPNEFEHRLYLARKAFERREPGAHVCSISCRMIVYKALSAARQLPRFYLDLADPAFGTAFAVFHQRYSTNTVPSWPLAQPFRLLAANGEVNTLWANRAWMRARAADLPAETQPVLTEDGSDSLNLDEAFELLIRHGREVDHALGMLLVPAWEETADRLAPEEAAFRRYHAPLMEPWDGPAAVAFSDGRVVGAALDRNGLRPCRYQITRDGLVVAGSEVGLIDLDVDSVIRKARLGPGQILLVDMEAQRLLLDDEVKGRLASRRPFEGWVGARPLALEAVRADRGTDGEGVAAPAVDTIDLRLAQRVFGFGAEELRFVVGAMSESGKDPVWSMGDDTPVPPLGHSPRSIYPFLRQRFAQVTNPAIDPLREASVMSLRTWLGSRPPLLSQGPQPLLLELDSPVITEGGLAAALSCDDLSAAVLDCTFEPGGGTLLGTIDDLCEQAEAAVHEGAALILLSDRRIGPGAAPVPMAMAVGALHHHLIAAGLRSRADLLVETGDAWDVHHLAVLIGYGAGAVCPWLALETARAVEPRSGAERLIRALELGLLKTMSKMGISTVASYRGGQMFEALGLADEVVDRCFRGTPSRIGGLGWAAFDEITIERHTEAVAEPDAELPDFGRLRYRRRGPVERHAWSPHAVRALQRAIGVARRSDGAIPDPEAWDELQRHAEGEFPANLRDLLDIVADGAGVALEEVEPAEAIARRFVSSAMSLGALSPEAHRTLAIAMNRLGARSNTGEGGEDPDLYHGDAAGERADGKIKQIASGRFGVTAEYVARAEELEIKIAQGSKPGEGGQLPGHKVTELIARLRHAQPGIALISPPPHHDIYSIEDLAQLIYDLKVCNPRARVGVKLVAEAGVGTIAAGVAKAYADYIVISGHSGGTGASPLTSIKHAGSPWELGLAEAQQVLIRNGLRSRVRLRTDGGLLTGSDVVVAALLGAEEFGFGTAPLVALGCDMARQCHLNTCPTGIATQRPELRAKFRGSPEHVVRYFLFLAEDVRRHLARIGLHSLDGAVGRVDLLRQVRAAAGLDLTPLLARAEGDAPRRVQPRNDRPREEDSLEEGLLREAADAIAHGRPYRAERRIRNSDRAVGARISGEIALRHGGGGLTPHTINLRFSGVAGQSFGAFGAAGLRLELEGEANDYVGKSLAGAEIVLRPTGTACGEPHRNVILGNVALYGATAGRLFAAGTAGERFAIRNSGAVAIVEGIGDHGCEYMTGGIVVVLGRAGSNLGAGMTGGEAFVYDEGGRLRRAVNPEFVECVRPADAEAERLRRLIAEHHDRTGSTRAAALLGNWHAARRRFWRVVPRREESAPRQATRARQVAAAGEPPAPGHTPQGDGGLA